MSDEEAIEIARRVADGEGWPWLLPVEVTTSRALWFMGPRVRQVATNSRARGCNIRVQLDTSGRVLSKAFCPR